MDSKKITPAVLFSLIAVAFMISAAVVSADHSAADGEHTVTYDVAGGSEDAPTQAPVAEGGTFIVAGYGGIKAGYIFGGWNDTHTNYSAGSTYTVGHEDVVLTAVWIDKPAHSVTYDVAGGSKEAPAQPNVNEDMPFTVAAYDGTKAGFAFSGWNDGTGDYAAGSAYTMGHENIVLTAVWQPIRHITYDVAGGSTAAPTQADVPQTWTFTVAPYDGIKAGYIFGGWNDTHRNYYPGSPYTVGEEDVVLTAVWNDIPAHHVTYNVAGGYSPAPSQPDVKEGMSFAVAPYDGIRAGFVFGGWNDGHRTYKPSDEYVMGDHDLTLSAVWLNARTVTYDAAGGSAAAPTQPDVGQTERFMVAGYAGIKDGFMFCGWNDTHSSYTAGSFYTVGDEDVVLTAIWVPTVPVTFDPNGGTGTMSVQNVPYNISTALNANTFTMEGYYFSGWALTAGGDVAYSDGGNITLIESTTLYAKWSQNAPIVDKWAVSFTAPANGAIKEGDVTVTDFLFDKSLGVKVLVDGDSLTFYTGDAPSSGTILHRVHAVPDTNYAFGSWTGITSGAISADLEIGATFQANDDSPNANTQNLLLVAILVVAIIAVIIVAFAVFKKE